MSSLKKQIIRQIILIILAIILLPIVLFAAFVLLVSIPIGEETITDPQSYLEINRRVRKTRQMSLEEGGRTSDFLPAQIDLDQTESYLFWSGDWWGDPQYAISVTRRFPTDEDVSEEIERLLSLDGFVEREFDGSTIICKPQVDKQLEAFYEPPLEDGSPYLLEYAIVSPEDRTVTCTEVNIYEGAIFNNEQIRQELEFVYSCTNSHAVQPVKK